ncbi:PfkB family carbohydrate kinase, partial [Pseudonocardia sp.]|uniref:PfkB family carbohydrate kinase n=1 Tax=Pseudonocardia sp. TaxID=60912 RepID=UPI0031FD81ED
MSGQVDEAAGGLVTLGETLGLLVAEDIGPLALAHGMRLSMGGAESNVAIGVSRLGVPATWIGRLGRDPIGDLVERHLLAERVRAMVRRDDAPTALMLRERRTGTSSHVYYYRHGSAGSHLCPTTPSVPVTPSSRATSPPGSPGTTCRSGCPPPRSREPSRCGD